jgi:hypothetical protein
MIDFLLKRTTIRFSKTFMVSNCVCCVLVSREYFVDVICEKPWSGRNDTSTYDRMNNQSQLRFKSHICT